MAFFSLIRATISLSGSSRSPKCMALVGQMITQAGLASRSTPGFSPWPDRHLFFPCRRRISARRPSDADIVSCRFSHARSVPDPGNTRFSCFIQRTHLVRTGDHAVAAAHALVLIYPDDAVFSLLGGAGGTDLDAFRFGALVAAHADR